MARTRTHEVVSELVANVLSVDCAVGDTVSAAQPVVLLESMKMEIPVLVEHAGTISAIKVGVGDVVQDGDVLVVVDLG
mgnify:CR=1 FL=1|jgi:biotin carboxyl carrier protein